ncbi:Mu transposase C-terminal domain-containing protein [Burkholderia perseverans]|uniref:Mu transposase C-terminal domain-containing protein n=1 Tax=Burkholderia perseverans TaxID=2615214 RepID=UPI001FED5D7D|nr:Mu transposase C-terminal domain-containing protein [Burkholderia perseverans]
MTTPIVKTHYAAAELAAMGLRSLPGTMQGINQRARSEQWSARRRIGRGGGREFAFNSLPTAAQDEIRNRAANVIIGKTDSKLDKEAKPAPTQLDLVVTDEQRLREDARRGILTTLDRLMLQCHVSRETAMTTLLTQAKAGTLDDHLIMMLRAARDERGRKGDGFPSIRTLKRYLGQAKAGTLAPKLPRKEFEAPVWAKAFLGFYQLPQKPSVELAYREFERAYAGRGNEWAFPTIHQVRRFLGKLGSVSREVGRMGPRELKNIRPFVRRTFDQLRPNDVWSADGHTFDAEVQHPLHGRPFRPEITSIIDIATRMLVGFSIGLAESSLVVLEAISHAAVNRGTPAVFYVDNGSGYSNELLKREGTGLQGLLGFEVTHSLPYNSQAKGVIERSHQTIWIQGAQRLPSYVGKEMDRESRLANFKVTRAAVKNGGAMPLIGWEQFVQFCMELVNEYNARAHRSLPKVNDPLTGKKRHMSPNEAYEKHRLAGWEPHTLTEAEARSVFRPRMERSVARGEINLLNNRYFSAALEEFHGDRVQVAFDIHDASRVWVYDLDGRFICDAEFGANERHYMPMSFVEQAREKRADARAKRLETKFDEVEAERRGAPALTVETPNVITIPGFGEFSRDAIERRFDIADVQDVQCFERVAEAPSEVVNASSVEMPTRWTPPETPEGRFALWTQIDQTIAAGQNASTPEEAEFYGTYALTKEIAAMKRREQDAGGFPLASSM